MDIGVTTPAVNKWENSNSKPDIELLALHDENEEI